MTSGPSVSSGFDYPFTLLLDNLLETLETEIFLASHDEIVTSEYLNQLRMAFTHTYQAYQGWLKIRQDHPNRKDAITMADCKYRTITTVMENIIIDVLRQKNNISVQELVDLAKKSPRLVQGDFLRIPLMETSRLEVNLVARLDDLEANKVIKQENGIYSLLLKVENDAALDDEFPF